MTLSDIVDTLRHRQRIHHACPLQPGTVLWIDHTGTLKAVHVTPGRVLLLPEVCVLPCCHHELSVPTGRWSSSGSVLDLAIRPDVGRRFAGGLIRIVEGIV